MKIRSDFVTNSSSSSFILGFKAENTIAQEIYGNIGKVYADILYEDVMHAKRLSHEEALAMIREEEQYTAEWIAVNRVMPRMSYREAWDWAETDEGKFAIQQVMDEIIDNAKRKMIDHDVVVEVEYGDHTSPGSELEHNILPNNLNTIRRISHH